MKLRFLTTWGLIVTSWLTAAPVAAGTIQFERKLIADASTPGAGLLYNPTSIAVGPDGKLYVANQTGRIFALTLDAGHNVTGVKLIETIFFSPNRNSDGSKAADVYGRLVLGLSFDPAGTPEHPVLYVTHSDPRIGENNSAVAQAIDNHSGVLTRLTGPDYDNPANRTDLITGLPRSRENHAPAGMSWGNDGWLYFTVGSNTNNGAPSTFFSGLPEYYLTSAVLRANVKSGGFHPIDVRGITGRGQELPGLFEVFATGYRNTYDIVWHSNGNLYGVDNGANGGLGGTPGPQSGCPGGQAVAQPNQWDHLHAIYFGSYGGHPNPARGECVFNDGSLYSPALAPLPNYTPPLIELEKGASTDGIAEYQSAAFVGAMAGNLIAATYGGDENVRRFVLSPDGYSVIGVTTLGKFNQPLDVAVDYLGVIYVAEHGGSSITALIPQGGGGACPKNGPPATTDSDGDGFTDADEIANESDLCNGSSFPPDFDADKISDLRDPDDDNDGIADGADPFFFDAANGAAGETFAFEWNPGDQPYGAFANTGFTGAMLADAGPRVNTNNLHSGAAGGYLSLTTAGGAAEGPANDEENALQLGVDGSAPFRVHARMTEPFGGVAPQAGQQGGIFVGRGPDDYLALYLAAGTGGRTGVKLVREAGGQARTLAEQSLAMPGPKNVELVFELDPLHHVVKALYDADGTSATPALPVGELAADGDAALGEWFTPGLAVGLLTTHGASGAPLTFVYDYFRVERLRAIDPAGDGREIVPAMRRRRVTNTRPTGSAARPRAPRRSRPCWRCSRSWLWCAVAVRRPALIPPHERMLVAHVDEPRRQGRKRREVAPQPRVVERRRWLHLGQPPGDHQAKHGQGEVDRTLRRAFGAAAEIKAHAIGEVKCAGGRQRQVIGHEERGPNLESGLQIKGVGLEALERGGDAHEGHVAADEGEQRKPRIGLQLRGERPR